MVDGTHRPLDRNGVLLFAIPMAVTTILAWVGDAFAPTLLVSAPLVLIVCNPRLRNLVLTAPTLGAAPFIAVAVARLVLTDPFFYWFGLRYGDASIRWMENKLGPGAAVVLWLERFFARAGYVAVTVLPNQWICLLAGATKMRVRVFIILNVGGTIAKVLLIWWLGDVFADPILAVNDWIGDHRLMLTVVTFGLVFVAVWRQMRKGGFAFETPTQLAGELEELGEVENKKPDDTDA
jgi:membrane protein DedA with SNARE-associated domain